MRITGTTHLFLGDVLPPDFRQEIFSLVEAAWARVKFPHDIKFEPRITGLLQLAMVEEHESTYQADPSFDVREDLKIRDPITGKEVQRMDLGIWLRQHYIKGQRPYFVFESKKLNISRVGVLDSNVHEYLGDGRVGASACWWLSFSSHHRGMLAFVMDGNVVKAKQAVEKQLKNKSEELQLYGEAKIHSSRLMCPKTEPARRDTSQGWGADTFDFSHVLIYDAFETLEAS